MSELPTNPKKPKLKTEDGDEASQEEHEQVLVTLVDHRSDEIERLKHHISNYQTKLVEAERSLRVSKSKLAHLRDHDDNDRVSIQSISAKNDKPLKTLRNVNDDEPTRNLRNDYASPSPSKTLKPCDSSDPRSSSSSISKSKSKSKAVAVKQKSETSRNVKDSGDRDRGTKRKFEQKEHKELIRLKLETLRQLQSSAIPAIKSLVSTRGN